MKIWKTVRDFIAPPPPKPEPITLLGETIEPDSPLYGLAVGLQLSIPSIRSSAISRAIAEQSTELVAERLTSPEAWDAVHQLHERPSYRETIWNAIWRRTRAAPSAEQQQILLHGLRDAHESDRPVLAHLYTDVLVRIHESANAPDLTDIVVALRRIVAEVEEDGSKPDLPWRTALDRITQRERTLPIPSLGAEIAPDDLPYPANGENKAR